MSEKCENKGCEKEATKLTTTETKYIYVCADCYNKKYKS